MKYFITAKNIFIEKVSPKSIHVLRSSYLYPFTSLRPMLSNYHSSLIPQNLVCEIVTFPSNGEKTIYGRRELFIDQYVSEIQCKTFKVDLLNIHNKEMPTMTHLG